MTTRKKNENALLRHLRAEAAFDLTETLATLHPQVLLEDQPVGLRLVGRQACAEHYELWWRAFGLHSDGGRLHWLSDEMVVCESHFRGVHRDSFIGVKASNKKVRFPFVVIVRFKDGLLSGERFYYDLNGVLRQISPHPRDLPSGRE